MPPVPPPSEPGGDCQSLTGILERNISALIERRQQEQQRQSRGDKIADAVTSFTGSMNFVYVHVMVFGLWILINLGTIPGISKFDPSFVILAMTASVEAIFLSTFVLITQNRMAALADKRADLDLQISLLAEHELTRLITLVQSIAERMGIEGSRSPELAELTKDVRPEQVLDQLEQNAKRSDAA